MRGNRTGNSVVESVRALSWILLATRIVLLGNGADQTAQEQQPDPISLLQAVAQARQQIASGQMELEVSQYEFDRPKAGTNYTRLKLVFDGEKRRFDQFSR